MTGEPDKRLTNGPNTPGIHGIASSPPIRTSCSSATSSWTFSSSQSDTDAIAYRTIDGHKLWSPWVSRHIGCGVMGIPTGCSDISMTMATMTDATDQISSRTKTKQPRRAHWLSI